MGRSLQEILDVYDQLKSDIFSGTKPHGLEKVSRLFKGFFGSLRMSDIEFGDKCPIRYAYKE